jgi:DNA-binding NarL/FixJ family response regulator
MKLKVLVVDDTDMMRRLVRQYLDQSGDASVVGEASDGEEAIAKARDCKPDIVLLDMNMPGKRGVEVARELRSIVPDVRIYIFSAYDINEFKELDIQLTVDGFVQKSSLKSELEEMVRKEVRRKDPA